MDEQNTTKEELICQLHQLERELETLKGSCQTENKLSQVDERWKYAFEITHEGLWDWDFVTNKVFYSLQWKSMLGFTDFEIGDTVEEWYKRVHPDDLEMVMKTFEKHLNSQSDIFLCEHRMLCKNGVYRWVLEEGRVIKRDKQGNPLQAIGRLADISDRKNTEFVLKERLKELECHNQISELLNNSYLSVDQVAEMIVHFIPPAWQYPSIAEALVKINNKIFKTPGYSENKNRLIQELNVNHKVIGHIEVTYPDNQIPSCDHVFLREESDLLLSIAVKLGNYIEKEEKKQIEFELHKTEALYRKMVETINEVIYEVSADGTIMFVSPAIERILGYRPDEITGKNFFTYMYSDDRPLLMKALSELAETDYSYLEYRYLTKSGDIRWVRSSTTPIFENGVLTGGRGSLNDIHARKLAEASLMESESNFRILIEAAPVGIIIVDENQKILLINKKLTDITGYSNKDVHTIEELRTLVYPDKEYRNTIESYWNNALENYKKGKSDFIPFDGRVKCKDGSIRYLEFSFVSAGNFNIITFVDVTERQQTANELTTQKNYTESILAAIPDLMFILSAEGVFLEVNPGKEKELSMPPELFLNKNISEVLPESICNELFTGINQLKEGHIKDPIQYKMPIDGVLLDFEARLSRFGDDKFIALVSNISWRKQSEEALRKSEEKYKALFFDSPEGYLIISDGKFIECNKASEVLIGGDRSKILNKTPFQLSPEYQPNGRISEDYCNELIRETIQKGSNSFEWVHKRFDGAEILCQVNLTVIEYEGNQVLFTTWQDITISREAEELLRKLSQAVEQSPVSIVITNLEGKIEYANPKACDTTGYRADELLGKNPRLLKSGETQPDEYTLLWDNISNGKEWHGVFHNKRKNGELYWESSTISPIHNSSGKITHFIAIKEDITSRRQMEDELKKSQERFSQIAEISQTMIWETDATGLYT